LSASAATFTTQENLMASSKAVKPSDKPTEEKKKEPAAPVRNGSSGSRGRPERPIADVDRKVRGGDA
jgi:hypothetical protein